MWPLPLFCAIWFAPESPWWLVRQNRPEDAKKALLRLTSVNRETDFDADETIAMMVHTTALEEKITAGASYLDCFRGTDLRRTEVSVSDWLSSRWTNETNYCRLSACAGPCKTSAATPSPTTQRKPLPLPHSPSHPPLTNTRLATSSNKPASPPPNPTPSP